MSRRFLLVVLLLMAGSGALMTSAETPTAVILSHVDAAVSKGPFAPNWKSLEHFAVPAWYEDGKFGIFIHWGLYSVPAFGNEWYPRNMYKKGTPEFAHHVATFGPQSTFGYKDFIPKFTAERFDPAQWAALFKEAGARYVVPVAEHHDGFPMYDCSLTDWSAAKMGPKRDVIGELSKAVRAQGIVFGVSSHRAEHWWFFDQGKLFDSDVRDPKNAAFYGPAVSQTTSEKGQTAPNQAYLDDWLARTAEIVDKYQPQLVWFDWWIAQPAFSTHLQRFAAFYYNRGAEWGQGVAINYKKHGGESFPDTSAVLDIERGQLAAVRQNFWQTDTSVSKNSWGHIEGQDYKSVDSIVDDLVDIVSKNGSLLLNIGPRSDGTIPDPEVAMLKAIGGWLRVNGEAIYGTRPWTRFGEGPTQIVEGPFADTKRKPFTSQDVRFTTRRAVLYATVLDWPSDSRILIKSLAKGAANAPTITTVELLGATAPVTWSQQADGLHVQLPVTHPSDYAFSLRISHE